MHPAALLALLVLLGAVPATAQPRGVELFGAMLGGPLIEATGPTRIRWLPPGLGYLETARDSSAAGVATKFFRVDPGSGRRLPLFDTRTEARIIAEYGRLSGQPVSRLPFEDFTFEREGKAILFEAAGRRYLFDLDGTGLRVLLMPEQVGPLDEATTEAGAFSPDFNHYAFIRDYDNLFLFDTRTGREERLTTGTSENNLIGFLGAGSWFVWSPDSKRIVFIEADQRALHQYPILRDLPRHATVEYFRYPFTSDPNPPLVLNSIDIATKTLTKLVTATEEMPYLRDIVWFADGSEVVFQLVGRWENRRELRAADPVTGKVRTLLVDEDSTYLDPIHNFREVEGGKRFTWSSERSGWRHLYLHDRQGTEVRQLTSGEWVTNEIVAIDHERGWVYFEGATNLGLEQHLFRVKLDGTGLTRLTPEAGVHRVSVAPAGRYFTDLAATLSSAPIGTLRSGDGRAIRELSASDVSRIKELQLAPPELLTLTAADGKTPMHGLLYKPADFDSTKRYPMIVSIYGGPHTKAVRNSYQTADFNSAVAQLGFLVAEFDGRGTVGRGKAWQAGSYLRMGQEDVDDQAAAVKQLRRRPYLDSTRVGVTGISHGGFMTMMMMLRYPDVYQVGAAGAPITDLGNGPRQYIGRIMRTPQANPDGYAKADLVARAGDLRGRLLLYHGTNDRNAVIGNTMQFVRKAIDAGRPVDMMIYPDGIHVLEGADAIHGLKTMLSYFLEHLRPEDWERSRAALWR